MFGKQPHREVAKQNQPHRPQSMGGAKVHTWQISKQPPTFRATQTQEKWEPEYYCPSKSQHNSPSGRGKGNNTLCAPGEISKFELRITCVKTFPKYDLRTIHVKGGSNPGRNMILSWDNTCQEKVEPMSLIYQLNPPLRFHK